MTTGFETVTGKVDDNSRLTMVMKETAQRLAVIQGGLVMNWDGKGISSVLPNFIAGMARIGKFDLAGFNVPMVVTQDGKAETDPRLLILAGRANETQTLEFIYDRLSTVSVQKHEVDPDNSAYVLAEKYDILRDSVIEMSRDRRNTDNVSYDKFKRTYGVGFDQSELAAIKLERDKVELPKVMGMLEELSREVNM